jgi:hypothetical protein
VQDEADVQATLAKLPPPCEGLGVDWMRHRVPFQCSTMVLALGVKASLAPTAVQEEAEIQATPSRAPPPAAGFGVASIRHRVPFHRSAKGTDTPELPTAWPTPVHAEGDEHDTLNSALNLAPRGLGVRWTVHLPPSRRSARVTTTPEPLVKSPTAAQEDEREQETPKSWPVRVKRFRVGTIDHPGLAAAAGATEALILPLVPATFPTADAASVAAVRKPASNTTATSRDPENHLRAEPTSHPR